MLSKGKETYPGKQFLPRVGYAYMCVHVCALMGAHYVQGTKERVGYLVSSCFARGAGASSRPGFSRMASLMMLHI